MPDHLFGATERETLDKVFGAYKGARQEIGDRGAVPKSPAEYKFEASDKLKPFVTNFDKDPVFGKAREIAHKAGLTDKQFNGFVAPMLEQFVDGGLVDKPINANAHLASLAPPGQQYADDKAKQTAGAQRVNDNIAWVDGAKTQGTFGKAGTAIADFLSAAAASDPRAHLAIEWLRGKDVGVQPALGGTGGGGGQSDADLQARNTDARGDPRSPKYDKAFAAETDRLYQQRYR